MRIDIPYPDTDYKPGNPNRVWGTATIDVDDLNAFLDAEVSAGRITGGEKIFILRNKAVDVRRAQAYGMHMNSENG